MTTLPLSGIRVVDLGLVWAGPHCTAVLGDFGAEVIRVESAKRPDLGRNFSIAQGIPIRSGSNFYAINRNKFGCSIDLSSSTGNKLFKRLVAVSDVVVENFVPRVMPNLGLDYSVLKEINPEIIMVSLSGFGQTGPMRDYRSYGPLLESFGGAAHITGDPEGPPGIAGGTLADPTMGVLGAFAVMAALHHRRKTGHGQYIDLSQFEGMVGLYPEAVMDYVMNGRVAERMGNNRDGAAPRGVYRCSGEDEWIAISVTSDEEWKRFCEVLGALEWTSEPRFADQYLRWCNRDTLDSLVESWTITKDKFVAMELLQGAGVMAAAVMNGKDLAEDKHLLDRQTWVQVSHPTGGEGVSYAPVWRMSHTPLEIRKNAPLDLGEDNTKVFRDILGLSEEEYESAVREQAIY